MKFRTNYLLPVILSIFILVSCSKENSDVITNQSTDANKLDQYVVIINDNIKSLFSNNDNSAKLENILKSYNISMQDVVYVYDKVFNGFCAKLTNEQFKSMENDPRILSIEKDQIVTIQGFQVNTDQKKDQILVQTSTWGINAVGSVDATTNSGVAWILDTGVDLDHADLNVNTTLARTFITNGQDANSADDRNGHGSHCAGIIAAKNNTIGVKGVCAGATVIPVKVLNQQGSGTMSGIIAGINYVANNLVSGRLNVVNMSFGGSAYTALDNAVSSLASAGAYCVIAAGNSSANAANYSPSRVNGTRIYTISAHNSSGVFATFSNYGNPPIDYSAPGVSIYSCYKNNGYTTMSGTSMAAPHVAGIILSNNGTISTNGTVTSDRDSSPDSKAVR